MGYKPQKTIYKLVFEEPDFEGLEVKASAISIGKLNQITRLQREVRNQGQSPDPDIIDEMWGIFASALVSWNVEDEEGNAVPANLEGLYQQDTEFVKRVIKAWTEAQVDIPGPLGQPSSAGGQFPGGSIPMETL